MEQRRRRECRLGEIPGLQGHEVAGPVSLISSYPYKVLCHLSDDEQTARSRLCRRRFLRLRLEFHFLKEEGEQFAQSFRDNCFKSFQISTFS